MIDSTLAKKLGKKACIAACLGAASVLGCSSGAADSEPVGASSLAVTGVATPHPVVATPPVVAPFWYDTASTCGGYRLWFDGACRELSFFARLRSANGTLLSVAGNRAKTTSTDTGVIITETAGAFGIQQLFLSPARLTNGVNSVNPGYLLRDGYPLVMSETTTFWKDDNGKQNRFIELRGPVSTPSRGRTLGRMVFGTTSWTHRVDNIHGYDELRSDGTEDHPQAIPSSSGSSASECASKGADARASYITSCEEKVLTRAGAAIASGLLAGAGVGMMAAGVIIIVGSGGTAALPVAVAITAIGATVGGAGAGVTASTMNIACDANGDAASARAEAACLRTAQLPPATDFKFVADSETGTPGGEPCPNGTVSWNGPANYCATGGSENDDQDTGTSDNAILSQLDFDGMTATEQAEYEVVVDGNASAMTGPTCVETTVTGACAIVQ